MSFGGGGSYSNYGSTMPRVSANIGDSSESISLFHSLSDNIGVNLFSINSGASSLERSLKLLGGPADTDILREQIQKTQHMTSESIKSTTRYLKEMGILVQNGTREYEFNCNRLKNEFNEILKRYDGIQKQLSIKIKLTQAVKKVKPSFNAMSVNAYGEDQEEETKALIEAQKQEQVLRDLEHEQDIIREREQRVNQIERDMVDVNQIARDLATLVHEGGEIINTIEANIETAHHNVEEGHQELVKASQYASKYRSKLCCLMIFLAIILIVAIIVIVIYTKN